MSTLSDFRKEILSAFTSGCSLTRTEIDARLKEEELIANVRVYVNNTASKEEIEDFVNVSQISYESLIRYVAQYGILPPPDHAEFIFIFGMPTYEMFKANGKLDRVMNNLKTNNI